MNYKELLSEIKKHNEINDVQNQFGDPNRLYCVVVFKNESWPKRERDYTLEERSYVFTSDNKAFISRMYGRSIFATTLDGQEHVRLDWYIGEWSVEDCYFMSKEDYEKIKEKEKQN